MGNGERGGREERMALEQESAQHERLTMIGTDLRPTDGPSTEWLARLFPPYRHSEGIGQQLGRFCVTLSSPPSLKSPALARSASRLRQGRAILLWLPAPSALLWSTLMITTLLLTHHWSDPLGTNNPVPDTNSPRQRFFGCVRGLQCLDRTDTQLLCDRHHRSSLGPLAVLRPHDRHSAHVLQTYRPARRAANRSIGSSSNPAFDSIERTMTVLTWYSSSTPFSFWKENYVSSQQTDGAFHRILLTLPDVHPASSSSTRQPFDGYRAIASIPTNSARISAVIACVSLSDALVKPTTSDLQGFTARTLPAQRTAVAGVTISDESAEFCHRVNVAITIASSDSPRSMRRERDTTVLPPKEAHCRTSTLPTCRQVEPDDVPADVNPSPMRGMDTAVLPPKEAQCRTQTLSIRRQAKPAVPPADANTLTHRGRDTAVLPPKEAQCRTPTLPPRKEYRAPASIPTNLARISAVTARVTTSDVHLWDTTSLLPNAHASSTALSPTKADADGKP